MQDNPPHALPVDLSFADDLALPPLPPGPPSQMGDLAIDDGCPPEATWIYVFDQDGLLTSIKPNQKDITQSVFTDIGKLACKNTYTQPFSMAVDRSGTAWVEYHIDVSVNGSKTTELFKVSTKDASCTSTDFKGPQQGIDWFGMGFVSDAPKATTEKLYVGGNTGGNVQTVKMGILDTTTLMMSAVGTGMIQGRCELSGTGNADLFGYFGDMDNPRISKIDKTTGAESDTIKLDMLKGKTKSFAFAFWGGDFWIFVMRDGDDTTTLYHVDGKTQVVTPWKLPRKTQIVGAGVSTCVPTGPVG